MVVVVMVVVGLSVSVLVGGGGSSVRVQGSSSVGLGPGGRAAGVVGVAEAGVDGGGRGQHVSGVAEGRQVAHVGHVARQRPGAAEGGALVLHALGELIEAVARPLAALGLAGHLAVACLDAFLLHGQRSVHLWRALSHW